VLASTQELVTWHASQGTLRRFLSVLVVACSGGGAAEVIMDYDHGPYEDQDVVFLV
jgi:hypothetical protein